MEEFEVLWDLDGKLVWWKGELLADPTTSSSAKNTFVGTLRYKPHRKYESTEYVVSFPPMTSSCDVKRLQHISPLSNELTPWKFPEDVVSEKSFTRMDAPQPTSRTISTNDALEYKSDSFVTSGAPGSKPRTA